MQLRQAPIRRPEERQRRGRPPEARCASSPHGTRSRADPTPRERAPAACARVRISRATSWRRKTSVAQRRRDDGLALCSNELDCSSGVWIKFGLSLERDRMRFERMRARFRCVCAHRGRYDRDHACTPPRATHARMKTNPRPRTRAQHTHHDDTTGPEGGDCMLVGETPRGLVADPPTVASPPSNG